MSEIKVRKPNQEELKKLNVNSWPIWEKERSRFNWHYDERETCFILEGKVVVETKSADRVEFGKGDLVTFSKGLDCIWDIKEGVRKHYRFG